MGKFKNYKPPFAFFIKSFDPRIKYWVSSVGPDIVWLTALRLTKIPRSSVVLNSMVHHWVSNGYHLQFFLLFGNYMMDTYLKSYSQIQSVS